MTDGDDPKRAADPSPDVLLLQGRTEDGGGVRAVRAREGRLELAELRPQKPGQPLHGDGELVRLHPRAESPLLWNVEVQWRGGAQQAETTPLEPTPIAPVKGAAIPPAPHPGSAHPGPARVATAAYRASWERMFAPPAVDEARGEEPARPGDDLDAESAPQAAVGVTPEELLVVIARHLTGTAERNAGDPGDGEDVPATATPGAKRRDLN